MKKDTTDKLTLMGRRRFLKSLSGLGISGLALHQMSKETLANLTNDPRKNVPILKGHKYTNLNEINANNAAPEREAVYTTIPRHKWNAIAATHNARQRIQNKINAKTNVQTDVLVRTTISRNQKRKRIIVPYPITEDTSGNVKRPDISFNDLSDLIPSTISGTAAEGTDYESTMENIPVSLEKIREKLEDSFNGYYRPVPAGCQIQALPHGGSCTLGMPKYSRNDNRWQFVTAGHCCNRSDKRKFHQPKNGGYYNSRMATRIPGEHRAESSFDAGVISRKSGTGKIMKLADYGREYRWPIKGTMSQSWLENLEDNNGFLRFQGKSSGLHGGWVTDVGNSTFKTTADTQRGDSGGPHFYLQSDDDAWIGGIHRGSAGGNAKATQMQNIENYFNLA